MEPNRSGLLAEYLFAGDAADTSGKGRHGAVYGAELVADRFGRPGQAYRYDGVDDYIEVVPPPPLPADAMSVSIWARYAPRDFEGYTNCLIAQDDGDDDDQSRRVFQLSTDGGHFIWHRMIGARDPMYRRVIRPGVWYHVVGVFDHGTHHLYVNGELCDSVEHRFWTHAEQPLHIGRKGTPEPYFFFKGELDDVRIYGRALGTGEIDGLWREGGWQPEPVAPATEPDPIGGHWGQDGIVFLDLRYDGSQRVSGRIMSGRPSNPAVISTGSFSRERGALRLSGSAKDPRDGSTGNFSIEGMLDQGELCVVARFKEYQGNFRFTRRGTRPRLTRRSVRSHLGALAYRFQRLLAS